MCELWAWLVLQKLFKQINIKFGSKMYRSVGNEMKWCQLGSNWLRTKEQRTTAFTSNQFVNNHFKANRERSIPAPSIACLHYIALIPETLLEVRTKARVKNVSGTAPSEWCCDFDCDADKKWWQKSRTRTAAFFNPTTFIPQNFRILISRLRLLLGTVTVTLTLTASDRISFSFSLPPARCKV